MFLPRPLFYFLSPNPSPPYIQTSKRLTLSPDPSLRSSPSLLLSFFFASPIPSRPTSSLPFPLTLPYSSSPSPSPLAPSTSQAHKFGTPSCISILALVAAQARVRGGGGRGSRQAALSEGSESARGEMREICDGGGTDNDTRRPGESTLDEAHSGGAKDENKNRVMQTNKQCRETRSSERGETKNDH